MVAPALKFPKLGDSTSAQNLTRKPFPTAGQLFEMLVGRKWPTADNIVDHALTGTAASPGLILDKPQRDRVSVVSLNIVNLRTNDDESLIDEMLPRLPSASSIATFHLKIAGRGSFAFRDDTEVEGD